MNKAEAFWDKASANYDKTEDRFESIHRKSRENTRKHLKDTDIVMDYGCGTGTVACEFSDQVKQIHAIDISSKMIDAAKEKAASGGIQNVSFAQADIFDDRYTKESFDVVLAFNMLHTVPDPQRAVRRIFELLKAGGVFVSVTPCLRSRMSFLVGTQIQLVRVLCRIGVIPVPIRRLRSHEIDALLADGGFQGIDAEEIYGGASSYFVAAEKTLKNDKFSRRTAEVDA